MGNFTSWAENELNLIDIGTESKQQIMRVIETFNNQGHSGFSASYALSYINLGIEEGYDVAKQKLNNILNKNDKDGMQQAITNDILEILDLCNENYLTKEECKIISRLLDWKPISPITGEDSEWNSFYEWDKEKSQQNKRCSAVFRKNNNNSTAYYINGKIFSDDGGETWFTNRDSFVFITFPYEVPDKPERIIL